MGGGYRVTGLQGCKVVVKLSIFSEVYGRISFSKRIQLEFDGIAA